jgi:SAM-dependent methyltransferase
MLKFFKKLRKIVIPHWTDLWGQIINFDKSMKVLHLGSGLSDIKNTISVDINSKSNPDITWDLNKTPWPFEENFFDIIIAMNVVEHLKEIISVMQQIHRVSKPDALVNILVPHFSSAAAFIDPTHKSFFSYRSFDYFIKGSSLEKEYGFYKEFRFELIRADIHIAPFWRYVPVVLFFVRNKPQLWEDYLCYLIRGEGIFFQLRVKK